MTVILIIAMVGLMICSGFFSSSETVFFSLNPLALRRVSQRNPTIGAWIHTLLSRPTQILSTVLIGNTIVNVGIAAIGFLLADRAFPGRGEAISIPVVTVALVIFGEAGPKRIGLLHAERLAVWFAPIMLLLIRALAPLRFLLERLMKSFEPMFRPSGRTLSEEEFETVLEISQEQGILNADELAMLKAIVDLEDLKPGDVMTPRVDLVGVDLGGAPEDWIAVARKARRNFLLLYRGQVDNVEGFLDVRKFLLDPEHRIESARQPPFFVPANTPLNQVLMQFQRDRLRIAVVVDEYGGVAGVITRGDILEEITGEIYNELSKPRPLFQQAGPHRWLVDANISLEEINRKLRLNLRARGADRLAGWIAARAGHIPEQDDVVEADGARVTVMQTIRRRVTLAQIEKVEGP
ncbi:MAG TPA: hemolysin family protein [Kiritimatiellia bacterium]|nr:hemolysin family protein [Kiritimatiellia bacterium]HRZ12779.1 hemolysin family protein [Kiritimatiellia bacterium]HSA18269.1 hemolysin family protein [Kiritimatiellia bacterium]